MKKVSFGGSWGLSPRVARVALRDGPTPGHRLSDLGLRLARSPVQRMGR